MNIDEAIEKYNKLSKACNVVFPQTRNYKQMANWLEQLKEYQYLEEQGRLLKLPCKVGDDVYYILGIPNETPCTIDKCTFGLSDINKIGKTLFLTRDEAEEKLKELRGNNNG